MSKRLVYVYTSYFLLNGRINNSRLVIIFYQWHKRSSLLIMANISIKIKEDYIGRLTKYKADRFNKIPENKKISSYDYFQL